MNILALAGLINFLSSAALGCLSYVKCPNRQVGRAYGVFNGYIAWWSFFFFLAMQAQATDRALFLWRFVLLGIIWINQGLLNFSLTFLNESSRYRKVLWTVAALHIFFSVLALSRSFILTAVPKFGFGFWPVASSWLYVYIVFWHAELFFGFWRLIQGLQHAESAKREQIKYMLTAFAIGYTGGGLAWLVWFDVKFPPHTVITVSVYSAIVSYAILRHQLMNINVVIRKTLIYSLVSAVLTCIYFFVVTSLANVSSGWIGKSSFVSIALAGVLVTLIFLPLYRRIQRFVDRHFFREALDQALLREATSGFVHEIKRPLINISLPAELVLADLQAIHEERLTFSEGFSRMQQKLQYILDQTADAGRKIEAIRAFCASNGDSYEELDLSEILRKSVSLEASVVSRNRIDLKLDFANELPLMRGSAQQLEILFSNLIKNAAEAIAKTNQNNERFISIKACHSQGGILVQVKDSGPGIPPENHSRVFEPYFTTKGIHGMGMGLYLCRQIAQAHGGRIKVISELARGATFTVELPA